MEVGLKNSYPHCPQDLNEKKNQLKSDTKFIINKIKYLLIKRQLLTGHLGKNREVQA